MVLSWFLALKRTSTFLLSTSSHAKPSALRARLTPHSVGIHRIDQTRLGRGQQLRKQCEIKATGGADRQRCVHVDADHVAAWRERQLARGGMPSRLASTLKWSDVSQSPGADSDRPSLHHVVVRRTHGRVVGGEEEHHTGEVNRL